ncbi:hypothetical protein D081_0365 [Anaerovibrio sp. JC8]|uniref:hypothetical protein n=1 Tax=Anaerovibrio sp. JC8 TaxID=1240085 RepID=UPI000A0CAE47|nr:hypothetical protein [Anaerovibrio sp. JC8]ORU00917.1 hypothetical protein D081_0365 [Anaerovibrio sp. JC8]
MSTQYKKIQKKNAPAADAGQAKSNMKPKASRDLLLLIMMAFSVLIMALGWEALDSIGVAMYTCLIIGMGVVYVNRHGNFTDKVHRILVGVSMGTLFASVGLLGLSVYMQYFA